MSLPNIADVHGKMGLSASDSLGVSEQLTHNKSVAFCSALGLDRGWQVLSFRPKAAYCMFLYSLPEGNDFHRLASEADMMIKVTHLKLKLAKMLSQRILPLSQEDAVTRKKEILNYYCILNLSVSVITNTNCCFLSCVFCIFSFLTSPPTKPEIFTNFLYKEKFCWSQVYIDHQLPSHFLYLFYLCVCAWMTICAPCVQVPLEARRCWISWNWNYRWL